MISVNNLNKIYKVHEKEPGFIGSVKSLFKREYNSIHAVKDISFEIEQGEIIGFIGNNGAGKTTTLKMLSGLLYPTYGSILINGNIPQKRKKQFLKDITMIMGQKQQLSWDLSAHDSLLVNQAVYEIPNDVFKRRLRFLSELLNIEKVLNKQVRKLSLGERMKCELASALIHEPSILFLDEPTIGLDSSMQKTVRRFIKEYNEKVNATIILTSHYMKDITTLSDRLMIIEQGSLIYDNSIQLFGDYGQKKEITILFQTETKVDKSNLFDVSEVVYVDDYKLKVIVSKKNVASFLATVIDNYEVKDININEQPIEKIIPQYITKYRKENDQVIL
ncbi:ABC transporter ATP-binding protein [Pseudogracilibacillus sp. SO30301A]|uniref:ABC transporter ATP-binding protein n=1 Tax=Pseudogracilibacillus sp. SO30301A TaxID=3098291 RepID=UPI00300DDF09